MFYSEDQICKAKEVLAKAKRDLSKLQKKTITDKRGRKITKWVKKDGAGDKAPLDNVGKFDRISDQKVAVIQANLPGRDEQTIIQALKAGHSVVDLEDKLKGKIGFKAKGVLRQLAQAEQGGAKASGYDTEAAAALSALQKNPNNDKAHYALTKLVDRKYGMQVGDQIAQSDFIREIRDRNVTNLQQLDRHIKENILGGSVEDAELRYDHVTKEDLSPAEIKQAEAKYAKETGDKPEMAFKMTDWVKDNTTGQIIPSPGNKVTSTETLATGPSFKPGEKVVDQYGKKLTVARQQGTTVYTKEEPLPMHATKIFPVAVKRQEDIAEPAKAFESEGAFKSWVKSQRGLDTNQPVSIRGAYYNNAHEALGEID